MDTTSDKDDYWNTSAEPFDFNEQDEAVPCETFVQKRLIPEDNVSEVSFEIPSNEMPLQMLISKEDMSLILQEQSMEDNTLPKGISAADELRILRKSLQDFKYPPSAEVTASKMLLGKPCTLEPYKALHDKESLLDEVVNTGNGSGILAVVLFLSKSLNKKQFNRILLNRPEACNHYLNYLVTRMKIQEATDLLTMIGRDQEAAILQFKIAVQLNADPIMKKQKLKKVFKDYFTHSTAFPFHAQITADAINLLEWQLSEKSIGGADAKTIVGSSAVESLYYVCTKHKWKDVKDPKNPHKFASDYHISNAQFDWTALNERATSQGYPDLDGLFEKSSWHSMKQKQFHIHVPLEIVIPRLYALKAPPAVLNSFLSKVSDPSKKLSLAKEVKAIHSIVDAMVALKEKQELESYRDTLIDGSEERFYADNSLKTLNKKWSTDGIRLKKS